MICQPGDELDDSALGFGAQFQRLVAREFLDCRLYLLELARHCSLEC